MKRCHEKNEKNNRYQMKLERHKWDENKRKKWERERERE